MPDYAPLPTAPESIWVGPADAELFFDQMGLSWVGSILGILNPRVVHIPTLCGSPPPATSEITSSDIAASFILGPLHDAALAKLNSWVDRAVWDNNCQAVDAPPPAPVVVPPPPADLPAGPIPVARDEQRMRDMYRYIYWMASEFVPRTYEAGDSSTVDGTGFISINPRTTGEWTREAVGVEVTVNAKPDYAGRSNGGDYPVYYDLGWYSLECARGTQSPIRLQHVHQITAASKPGVTGFFYNLPPGVEITVTALYPNLPSPPDGDA